MPPALPSAAALPGHWTDQLTHNVVDKDGMTALHLAAEKGLEGTCVAILASEHFTAHNVVDPIGRTALHVAAGNGLEGT